MAEVWLATDMSLSRQVAVKILKSTLAADPVVAERFRREAITVARLSHPNIVAVHDTIDYEGRQAVVMQLINGKSLRQLLDEQKRLGPDLTMHVGSCVAAALDAAHAAGLVHRDVKPGNILITPDGRVLLADFGIAKGLSSADDLTSENVMMGTAKYLSPEQVRGKKLDGRADLYALGLVLYECLAGRVPFLGESDADTALARLQRDPTDLSRLRPTLPYGLSSLIHELLARNPDDRPATGDELRTRLSRIASGADDRTTTITPPRGSALPGRAATPPRGSLLRADGAPTRMSQPTGHPVQHGGADRASGATPRNGPSRPINAPPPSRDRTPTSGSPRGVPAKQFQQKRTPSVIVIVLLLLAVIVAAVLWSEGGAAKRKAAVPAIPGSTPAAAGAGATGGPNTNAQVISFDPGDTQTFSENPDQVALAWDGNPATVWRTNCYSDPYFNGKPGVGLVVELSAAAAGTADITVDNAPYQLEVFASNAATIPASVGEWGHPVQPKSFSNTPGTVSAAISTPARFVLVLVIQAAQDPGCSNSFPYRAGIAEVSFTATP